jgi:predicted Zn finger-like uncharacterized protein
MIAACPTCGARYRIDTAKLRPEGARLRCSRCQSVFRVRAPALEGATPEVEPQPAPLPEVTAPPPQTVPPREEARAAPPKPPTAAVAPDGAGADPAADAEETSRERLVLVAHAEPEAGKAVAEALGSWGLRTMLVHDGVEAILNIQRALPQVVVLDAALPKMFGFQVCELMKRNESLCKIQVILVGAIHDRARYRRPPGELYGADAYIEPQQLPDGLPALLERFGLPVGRPAAAEVGEQPLGLVAPPQATSPPEPTPAPEAAPPVTAEPSPPLESAPPAPSDPALAAEVEQADRLARIIVSDIVLYNPEKFEAGLLAGDVVEALCSELEEGHALFSQRVDPRVGDPDDFLRRELVRVARSRGMER